MAALTSSGSSILDPLLLDTYCDTAACKKVLKIAKSLYFPDRTYQRILDAAGGVIDDEALKRFRRFIEAEKRDLKMEDAIEALKRIRDKYYSDAPKTRETTQSAW